MRQLEGAVRWTFLETYPHELCDSTGGWNKEAQDFSEGASRFEGVCLHTVDPGRGAGSFPLHQIKLDTCPFSLILRPFV
jgi:hypothetical protein